MATSVVPGDIPVDLNEARSWLRLGATIDDAVVAQLVRAATNICEAFIGQWLIVRAAGELLPAGAGALRLSVRPVVAVDAVTLIDGGGVETALAAADYRVTVARDGSARLSIDRPGDARRVRISYRAGMADDANGIPEAIRQGIIRMTQHMHDAREGGDGAPPAAIAALWRPWRLMGLGGPR